MKFLTLFLVFLVGFYASEVIACDSVQLATQLVKYWQADTWGPCLEYRHGSCVLPGTTRTRDWKTKDILDAIKSVLNQQGPAECGAIGVVRVRVVNRDRVGVVDHIEAIARG